MVVSARRLLQCCQMPDKNSRDISRYVYLNFFAVFKNIYVFNPLFLAEPLTKICGALRIRGTLFEKQ
jgi:hypothetical protein